MTLALTVRLRGDRGAFNNSYEFKNMVFTVVDAIYWELKLKEGN